MISLAVLSALRALAEDDALLVAIDDVQWLDRASEEALAYAARRLHAEPVTFLLARRPGPAYGAREGVPRRAARRVDVGAISLGATRQILADPARAAAAAPPAAAGLRHDDGQPAVRDRGRPDAGRSRPRHARRRPARPRPRRGPARPAGRRPRRPGDAGCCWPSPSTPTSASSQLHDLAGPAALGRARSTRASSPSRASGSGPHTRCSPRPPSGRPAADERAGPASPARRGGGRRAAPRAPPRPRHDRAPTRSSRARLDAAAARAAARGATRLAVDLGTHALRLTPPDVVGRRPRAGPGPPPRGRGREAAPHRAARGPRGVAAGRRCAGARRTTLLTEGRGAGQRRHPRAAGEGAGRGRRRPARCARRCSPYLAENEAVDRGARRSRAPTTAPPRRSPLSEHGSPDDQALAVHSAHLDPGPARAAGRAPGRAATTPCPRTRLHGPAPRTRGRAAAGLARRAGPRRARCSRPPRPGRGVGRGATRWRGCTCASWSCAPAGGARSQRMLDEWAEPRPTATCCTGRCTSAAEPCSPPAGATSRTPGAGASRAVSQRRVHRRALGLARGHARPRPGGAARQGPGRGGRPPRRRLGPHPAGGRRWTPGRSPSARTWSRPWSRRRRTTPRGPSSTCWPSARASRTTRGRGAGAQRGAALVEIHGDAYTDAAGDALEAAAATYGGLGLAFDEARTLLALGRAQRRAKKWGAARDVLERAVAAFEAIGSPGWADDARAELERGRRPRAGRLGRAHRDRAPRRRPRRRGAGQQGDRPDPGRHRQHRRVPPPQHLRQARHPLPRAARGAAQARRHCE